MKIEELYLSLSRRNFVDPAQRYLTLDVRVNSKRYRAEVPIYEDDFTSGFDRWLEICKREIIRMVNQETKANYDAGKTT
jgi:hypothetical protein